MVPWSKNGTPPQVVENNYQNGQENEKNKPNKTGSESCEQSKESFRLSLGSYKACTVPMCILFFGYTCGVLAVSPMSPDPRVRDWPLMSSSLNCLFICILYILFSLVWGPRFMKNREPVKLKKTLIVYNAVQVVLSAYMFFEVGIAGWFFDYNFLCQPCDHSNAPKAVRVASVAWLFFISKIFDFVDTLFFILNKKWDHISLLHIVHHSCMCISMWFGIKYTPGGHITFMGFLNSSVHILMYSYYFLSAFGPKMHPYLWWKRYLTKIQLIQFVAIFLHAASALFIDCPSVPIGLPIWTCIYAVIFFGLFTDFYYRAYLYPVKKGKKQDPKSDDKKAVPITEDKEKSNSAVSNESWEAKNNYKNGHIRNSTNLTFRIDSCMRERQTATTNA